MRKTATSARFRTFMFIARSVSIKAVGGLLVSAAVARL
jgi:hypothetical protein